MPNCLINLFLVKKLYNVGGYIKDGRLWTKTDKEICQIDKRLLIIEEKEELIVAYPAILKIVELDIELWHRRLGHLSPKGI
jgi:hypothetical protein